MKTTIQNSTLASLPETFTFHEDAGHGWLEVPYNAILALKIQDQLSGFSYRDGNTAYLEEDCDAPLFIKTYLLAKGRYCDDYNYFRSICKNQYDGDSSYIRNYSRY